MRRILPEKSYFVHDKNDCT